MLRRTFGCSVVLVLLAPGAASAQTLSGRVLDALSDQPIAAVEVTIARAAGGDTLRTATDAAGRFTLELGESGRWLVTASSLGYRQSETTEVEVAWAEEVQIEIRLATDPIELEGLTVTARGLATRHTATLAGFNERFKDRLAVGPVRLVNSQDAIMKTAFDVGDVLKWFFANRSRCFQLFIDGMRMYNYGSPDLIPVNDLEGIEYYRNPQDAPLAMRTGETCSVLALWRKPLGGGGR